MRAAAPFERQELLVFFATNIAGAQPVPMSLPPVVLVGYVWAGGHVGQSTSALAPRLPLFKAFQLEGACVQQRLLEREELVVFDTNITVTQPVPVPLPPLVLVGCVGGGGDISRPCAALAPRLPPFQVLQLEKTRVQQRLLERQELLALFATNIAGAQPVPVPLRARRVALPPVVRVDCVWVGGYFGRTRTALAPRLPLFRAFQLEGACLQQRLLERQELLVFFATNITVTQPVPVPLPSVVLVDLVRAGGNVGRPFTALAPRVPLYLAFQLEGTCVQ